MNMNIVLAAALLIVGILYLLRRRSRMNKED
jgi:LPXTG-motif cell wall-anchored protein